MQPPVLQIKENTLEQNLFWEINGSIDLAIIPGNTIKGIPHDLPIRLQNGYAKGRKGFGYLHILRNHGHEFNRLRPPIDVFEFLVKKLGQGGSFHYQSNKRKSLYLAMLPTGFIFLDYIAQGRNSFFTIVTAFTSRRSPDGDNIGGYISTFQVKPQNNSN